MGKNSGHPWGFKKEGPKPMLNRNGSEYPHHKRSEETYSQYLSGYSEQEIGAFFGIEPAEVLKDIQHVHQVLPPRTVLAHINDRNRLLIQKLEGEKYRRQLSESLSISPQDYLKAGVSPVGPMKEFREAVSMTEKPGALSVNVTKNTANFALGMDPGHIPAANFGSKGRITCFEDLVRMIIAADPSCSLSPPTAIEAKEFDAPGIPQDEDMGEEEPGGDDSERG
jgi:hypothetical protein